MTIAKITGGVLALVLVVFLALVAGRRTLERSIEAGGDLPTATAMGTPSPEEPASEIDQGFLYGRVVTYDGTIYTGRLRFGGAQEGFWGDYFNGFKEVNPWVAHAPIERLQERRVLAIFGIEFAAWEVPIDLSRPFMARFGDIARIEPIGRELLVTLRSGTVFHLDRFAVDDFADGLRVWDPTRGIVNLDESQIRSIDFLPTVRLEIAPERLHGTVRTEQGEFSGFLQWDREGAVGTDELVGEAADGTRRLRFDTIRSIARPSPESSLVTLLDGEEIVLSGTRAVGQGNRGVYVDDPRYGRVLVSWEAFERVDFGPPPGSGPAYGDFSAGRPLTGSVTTRAGLRLTGRLVYDLDESETTETIDAPSQGVDYTIFLGLIATIMLPAPEDPGAQRARVILHSGEEVQLELSGDLGEGNAGTLIFVDGQEAPEYLGWTEIQQIDFDRPPATFPLP